MVNFRPARRFKKHNPKRWSQQAVATSAPVVSVTKSIAGPATAGLGPSRLEALPREVKDEIVSYLRPTELNTLRLVSHNLQVSALRTWCREIPLAQRATLTALDSRPNAGAWRKAWLSQCNHLETLGVWGAHASLACKSLPDELNPYDVESQCRSWISFEKARGSTQVETVLEELFATVHGNEIVLKWSGRNIHSLPPFVDKAKALEQLFLSDNQLDAIDLKNLPALKQLFLNNNRLSFINLQNLPALKQLFLNNNRLSSINLQNLPALCELGLNNNRLSSIDLRNLPALCELDLNNSQLNAIDLEDLPVLQTLQLSDNQLNAINLKDLPALEWLALDDNQHHLVSREYRGAIL